jgi:hypothetical protein
LALSLCVVGSMSDNAEMFKGANTTKTCASIYYGNTKPNTAPSTSGANIDAFETKNLPTTTVSSDSATYFISKGSSTVGEGIKLASGSRDGLLTFTFASSISIYDAYIYASAYKNDGTVTVTTGSDTSTTDITVSGTSEPSICDPATSGALSDYSSYYHVNFDVTTATTTLIVNCASGNPIYLFKIVLSIDGSGSGTATQSLSSSLSAVSLVAGESNSSISLTPSGFSGTPTYTCVATDSTICSASVTGTTLTINGLKAGSTTLTITATSGSETASTTVDVTVTAPAGAYLTLDNTMLSLTAERDSKTIQATSHSFSGTVTYSASSSSTSVATVSINSTSGLATVTPVVAGSSTITITASNGVDSDISATCSVTVAALPTPTITLSNSTLSISTGKSGTLTATAAGFDSNDGVTYSASSSNTSAVSTSVANNVITLTGVSAGSSTITVTGSYTDSYGTQTAMATCAVTVSDYSGTTTYYSPYRIAPVKASGSTATVYKVDWNSSSSRYVATTYKTLSKTTDYIEQEDVAAYFEAFGTYPQNYKSSKSSAQSYGTSGRVVSTYTWGSYSGSNDYSGSIGSIVNGGTYYELDIGTSSTNSTYNTGSSINRGTYRVVAVPGAAIQNYADSNWTDGYAPNCFYTPDHYATFYEYYNCVRTSGSDTTTGFGDGFKGATSSSTTGTRVTPTTITY